MLYPTSLFHYAKVQPNRSAIILADRMVTFGMLAEGIANVEQHLQAVGLQPGDLVAVYVSNQIRDIILSAALHRCSIVSVSIDAPGILQASGLRPAAVLTDIEQTEKDLPAAISIDDDWFYGSAHAARIAPATKEFSTNQVCRVILSSGTTGTPRPIAYSNAILEQRLQTRISMSSATGSDKVLVLPTLASQIGWTGALTPLLCGGTVAFANDTRTALQMTGLYGLRSMLATAGQVRELIELQRKERFDCRSLEEIHVGAGFMTDELIAEASSLICPRILCRYGSTETGVSALAPAHAISGIPGAVGYVAPWARISVVDDNGDELPPGDTGELVVETGAVSPAFTADLRDIDSVTQPFRPGDIGHVREDSLLVLTGRIGDVLNAGGLKIAPEVIEQMVLKTEKVSDAAAVSKVGATGVEEVWIAVVAAAELDTNAMAERISKANPELGPVRIVRRLEIPRNQTGKIQRARVREDL